LSTITIAPNSVVQEAFLSLDVDELGAFGKKGWGKSWGILQECLYDVHHSDFNAIIFRRTSSDFEDLITKAHEHFAGYKTKFNGTKHISTFPSGARVRFAHLQHLKDIFTYNGQEFQLIIFDELPQFPMMVYKFMFSCLRGVNPEIVKRIRSTGNPYGEGMLQVKARFYDVLKPGVVINGVLTPPEIGWFRTVGGRDVRATEEIEEILNNLTAEPDWRKIKASDPELETYMSRAWLFGERQHNTHLMEADPGYEARLDQLPEDQRLAFKMGEFIVIDNKRQLIKSDWIDFATNSAEPKVGETDGMRFGADYAELGKDSCTMCKGRGNQVHSIIEWDYMTHYDFASEISGFINKNGRNACLGGVDSVGTGAGVYTQLRDHFNLADRVDPMRYKDKEYDKKVNENGFETKFDNLRSQMMYKLARDFEAGEIDLSLLLTQAYFYENFVLLQEEILSLRFRVENGVFKVIPKNELRKMEVSDTWGSGVGLGRSPDRLDALAIWNWCRDMENISAAVRERQDDADYGGYKKYITPKIPQGSGYT